MNRIFRCTFLGLFCVIVGCKHSAELTRLDSVKLAMRNAPSLSVTFCINFDSDIDGNFSKKIAEQKQIHMLCDAIVAKDTTWVQRDELLIMLTGASLSIKSSNSETEIFIVASDTIVFTEDKKRYFYGKTKLGLWKEVLSITKRETGSLRQDKK